MIVNNKIIESFDQIVFEKREKKYGAFDLRKRYLRNLASSVFFVNGLVILTFTTFLLFEKFYQFNEFNYIDHVEIEYYSLDTLLNIEEEMAKSATILEKTEQTSAFEVTDSTKSDTLVAIKNTKNNDTLYEMYDTSSLVQTYTKKDTLISKEYLKADVMPEFPGGKAALYRYITSKIISPGEEIMKNANGMVIIAFCIDESGMVSKPYIKKNLQPQIDSAVIRVIRSMPRWSPGKNENRNVKVLIHIPIIFSNKN